MARRTSLFSIYCSTIPVYIFPLTFIIFIIILFFSVSLFSSFPLSPDPIYLSISPQTFSLTLSFLPCHCAPPSAGFPPDPSPSYWSTEFGCPATSSYYPDEVFTCQRKIYDGIYIYMCVCVFVYFYVSLCLVCFYKFIRGFFCVTWVQIHMHVDMCVIIIQIYRVLFTTDIYTYSPSLFIFCAIYSPDEPDFGNADRRQVCVLRSEYDYHDVCNRQNCANHTHCHL